MKDTFVRRHSYFLGLSGLTLLSLFCFGVLLLRMVDGGVGLPVIEANSVYVMGLRLLIYGALFMCWGRLVAVHPVDDNDKHSQSKNRDRTSKAVRTYRYRIVLYLLLFEGLVVQQGWAALIQAFWR